MTSVNGAICDSCKERLPGNVGITTFFHTQERFCSTACLEAREAERRQEYARREQPYTVERGWIDCAGKTRTWLIRDFDGNRIAEVVAKRDALHLTQLLSKR